MKKIESICSPLPVVKTSANSAVVPGLGAAGCIATTSAFIVWWAACAAANVSNATQFDRTAGELCVVWDLTIIFEGACLT